MEVCGGQTHSIVKHGIDRLLPEGIELVHGPGCPVCVTPLETIDKAHAIAARPEVIFCSFGDMLRVPGSHGDLFTLKSQGADIRVVYSPLDCLKIARPIRRSRSSSSPSDSRPRRRPMPCWCTGESRKGEERLDAGVAFAGAAVDRPTSCNRRKTACRRSLGPGHVCAIMGYREYEPIASDITFRS